MQRFIKEEKGVVSIAMALLIPVIILGVLYIYACLDKPQQENTVHKIVYASSEAYLSRYNAYLFEQMGILANLDSERLEALILHYLSRNKLDGHRESIVLNISYEQLDAPDTFKEAVVEASTVLIGNAVVNYGVELLDQFAFAEKIRTLNQSVQNFEKKLSEQFDKIGATQLLKTIKQCRDVQSGRLELTKLESQLSTQYGTFFETLEGLKAVLTQIKGTIENPEQAMKTFLDAKELQGRASETAFLSEHQDYLDVIAQVEAQYACIESEEETMHQIMAQIEAEKLKKPSNQEAIDQLEALLSETDASVDSYYSEIDAIVTDLIAGGEAIVPSMIQVFKDMILEAEYLFSGIEIGSGTLVLEDAFRHSKNNSIDSEDELDGDPARDPNGTALGLPQKLKVNEYYLSIFSSYDRNCPRLFDPQNRQKTLRAVKGEVEYLLSGHTKEKQSISIVRLKILGIRSAANIVTLLCDKEKLSQLSTATVALPQPWRSLAYGAAIAAWSGLESYSDINRLMKGEGFYFLKTQAQWALDFDALLDGSWKNKMANVSSANNSPTHTLTHTPTHTPALAANDAPDVLDPNLYYLDYLRLLLLLQDEQTTLLRAMDLVEAELQGISKAETSLSDFSRGHVIDLTWIPQGIFGLESDAASTIHMRNGFK